MSFTAFGAGNVARYSRTSARSSSEITRGDHAGMPLATDQPGVPLRTHV